MANITLVNFSRESIYLFVVSLCCVEREKSLARERERETDRREGGCAAEGWETRMRFHHHAAGLCARAMMRFRNHSARARSYKPEKKKIKPLISLNEPFDQLTVIIIYTYIYAYVYNDSWFSLSELLSILDWVMILVTMFHLYDTTDSTGHKFYTILYMVYFHSNKLILAVRCISAYSKFL